MTAPPIRVLVAVLGLDQHEAGSLAIARILRDAGMEVVYTGRFQTPETVLRVAVEEDVGVVGISCHSWEFLHYAAELATMLHAQEPPIPLVMGGSVVTARDRQDVLAAGVDEAVLPTVGIEEIVEIFTRLVTAGGQRDAGPLSTLSREPHASPPGNHRARRVRQQ